MRKRSVLSAFILMLWGVCFTVCGQKLSFRSLGNEEGLNSTTAYMCAIDHHGFIWVATNDGLVRFDGKATKYFYNQDYPELPADQLSFVYCDHRNAIWACTDKGLARVDPNLQIEKQLVNPKEPDLRVFNCFETGDSNIIALTADGAFSRKYNVSVWSRLPWMDSILTGRRAVDIRHFDRDRITFVFQVSGVALINTATQSLETFIPKKGVSCAIKFDDHSILVGSSGQFGLTLVSIDSSFESRKISAPTFFSENNSRQQILYMTRASDGKLYITTNGRGVLCYDSTLNFITQYLHDPIDFSTIINNGLKYITSDDKGNLVITSLVGISYTNVNNAAVEYHNYLKSKNGDIVDDRVLSLAEDKHHRLWLCGREQVYVYDPVSEISERLIIPPAVKLKAEEIYPFHVERDNQDFIWIALRGEGILVYDPDGKFVRMLRQEDYLGYSTHMDRTRMLRDGEDGFMYVGTESGLFRIAHKDFAIDTFINDKPLLALRNARIVDMLPKKDELWISSSPNGAAWHYTFNDQQLTKFNTENGLSNNRIYGLAENGDGNLYMGTYNGFSIIHPDYSISNITKGEGLISPRIEAIAAAADSSIWLTNNFSILKYDPSTQKISRIGGRQGISNINFVIMSSTKLASGKIAFGATKGFVILDPRKIQLESKPIQVFLFLTDQLGKEKEILPQNKLTFNYREQHLRFSFAVNDLMLADQVQYRYRLTADHESQWSAPSQNAIVDFSLNPGEYTFELEAYDGYSWIAYPGPFHFTMKAPWWKQGWFIIMVVLVLITAAWLIFRERIKKYKKEIEVARQMAELESKALRAQMNPHFVFNSLNAIQECIVTGKIDEAYTYLSKFSRLLRMVLEHSDMSEVSLQSEIEVLTLYVALEKLRFKDEMKIVFDVDKELDTEEILIPPMLIQPHLENAIWHGLRDQTGEKILTVSIHERIHGYLEVIMEDNGIGRVKAEEMKKTRLGQHKHQSKGSKLSGNRVEILKNHFPQTALIIEDLYHENGIAKGTRVVLTIPILEKNTMTSNLSTT